MFGILVVLRMNVLVSGQEKNGAIYGKRERNRQAKNKGLDCEQIHISVCHCQIKHSQVLSTDLNAFKCVFMALVTLEFDRMSKNLI